MKEISIELLTDLTIFIAGKLGVAKGELENAKSDLSREICQGWVNEAEQLLEQVNKVNRGEK